jgi:hypothetical protein
VSTLNEIAANYARMAKALEDSKCLSSGEERDVLAALSELAEESSKLNEQFSTFAKVGAAPAHAESALHCV